MIELIVPGIAGYLLGSVTLGMIVPRLMGTSKDVRKEGSGNVGATNVLRTQGKLQGGLVLLGDLLKGSIAAGIGLAFAGIAGGAAAGIGALIGHCYPLYFGFKGGRGVATGAGIVFVLFPKAVLLLLPVFVLTVLISRMVSLGSITAALALLICLLVFQPPIPVMIFTFIAVPLIVGKHHSNIKRILAGTENKFGKSRTADEVDETEESQ